MQNNTQKEWLYQSVYLFHLDTKVTPTQISTDLIHELLTNLSENATTKEQKEQVALYATHPTMARDLLRSAHQVRFLTEGKDYVLEKKNTGSIAIPLQESNGQLQKMPETTFANDVHPLLIARLNLEAKANKSQETYIDTSRQINLNINKKFKRKEPTPTEDQNFKP